MTVNETYAPGACNIGPEEIARRRRGGYAGLAAMAVLLLVLIVADAAAGWYLLVFFPAFVATSGFAQAASRFCYAFGFASVFNFGSLGDQHTVDDDKSRRLDRTRALRMLLSVLLISVGAGLFAFGIAYGI